MPPNSSSPCGFSTSGTVEPRRAPAGHGIPERARAEAVDDVEVAPRRPWRPPRAPVDSRTAGTPSIDRGWSCPCARRRETCGTARRGTARRSCDHGSFVVGGRVNSVDPRAARQQVPHQVAGRALEAADAVQRRDGARQDRHAEPGRRAGAGQRMPRLPIDEVPVERLDAADHERACRSARPRARARGGPESAASARSDARRATCSPSSSGVDGEQAGDAVLDDVAGPAGVHRGDRDADGRGLEEHAAQRLGAVRREHQQRRVGQPRHHPRPVEPPEEPHVPVPASRPPLRARRAAGRRQRRRAARRGPRRSSAGSRNCDALVLLELAHEDRVRPFHRRRRRPARRAGWPATSTGFGMISMRAPRQQRGPLRAGRARSPS